MTKLPASGTVANIAHLTNMFKPGSAKLNFTHACYRRVVRNLGQCLIKVCIRLSCLILYTRYELNLTLFLPLIQQDHILLIFSFLGCDGLASHPGWSRNISSIVVGGSGPFLRSWPRTKISFFIAFQKKSPPTPALLYYCHLEALQARKIVK